ncbi:unnamed protein product [Echinostoma caproni]|uniref:Reverse transcriptase domain-containing protein n=1 Tax=Echinostoma caproni TaxID=27848 RepID=A0A183AG05_9TREM|nr:unnamed protein product [Echinostoma caproni]
MKPVAICELVEQYMQKYFKIEGEIDKQPKGTPEGSTMFGFMAEAVMQKVEKSTTKKNAKTVAPIRRRHTRNLEEVGVRQITQNHQ